MRKMRGKDRKDRVRLPANMARLETVRDIVKSKPSIRQIDIIHLTEERPNAIKKALRSMDMVGILLSEDKQGGLYLFREIDYQDALVLFKQTRTAISERDLMEWKE